METAQWGGIVIDLKYGDEPRRIAAAQLQPRLEMPDVLEQTSLL